MKSACHGWTAPPWMWLLHRQRYSPWIRSQSVGDQRHDDSGDAVHRIPRGDAHGLLGAPVPLRGHEAEQGQACRVSASQGLTTALALALALALTSRFKETQEESKCHKRAKPASEQRTPRRTHDEQPPRPASTEPQRNTNAVMRYLGGTLTRRYEENGCHPSCAADTMMLTREYWFPTSLRSAERPRTLA